MHQPLPGAAAPPDRPIWPAMRLGIGRKCPACGRGGLFHGYLRIKDRCGSCGEELHHQRADDAPPYFTIIIVGHIVVPAALALEKAAAPSSALHYAIWIPLSLLAMWWCLPRVKGALVGLQWAARMGGFDGSAEPGNQDRGSA